MGLWRDHGDRGKAYREVWSQGTEETGEEKGNPRRYREKKPVEKGKRPPPINQMEFLTRGLLVHPDIQKR